MKEKDEKKVSPPCSLLHAVGGRELGK